MELANREWKAFKIAELFDISGTITTHPSKLIENGKTPRITCAATNNAFEGTYKNEATEKGGVLTVDSATIGYVSFQATDFIATDHVEKISMKGGGKISRHLGLFLVQSVVSSTDNKYGYGYKFSQSRIKKQKILLPVNSKGEPDYAFMENYMRQKEAELLKQYEKQVSEFEWVVPLSEKDWKEFEIGKLFRISAGKSKGLNHLQNVDKGGINYLGATNSNNGVLAYVQKVGQMVHKGNSICFIRNGEGSMGFSIYKTEDFIATSDISVGYADFLNKYVGLFITTVADKVRDKYNFGYKRSEKRLKKEKILLPINSKNEPDFAYMENYMKALESEKIKQYLEHKKS